MESYITKIGLKVAKSNYLLKDLAIGIGAKFMTKYRRHISRSNVMANAYYKLTHMDVTIVKFSAK